MVPENGNHSPVQGLMVQAQWSLVKLHWLDLPFWCLKS
jgi:hypothetical protein